MNAISLDHLTIRYGKRIAVDDLSLDVPTGSVFALLGRNGAGKSSLVRTILGQQRPTRGTSALFGEDAWQHRASLVAKIGVVAEESDAPPEMRITEVARFFAKLYPKWDQSSVDDRLKRFAIDAKSRFGDLSKGQKKEVSLALALASQPELLVLDDPTLGLDVVARKVLFEEVVGELADRGITIFLTTHDLAGVEAIADRVGIMHDGRLLITEELETLKSRFRRIRHRDQLPSTRLHAVQSQSWGAATQTIVDNYDDSNEVLETEITPLSLEEIFIAVTSDAGGAA
jgi:ABC-2 type transport system ATP-binding protein